MQSRKLGQLSLPAIGLGCMGLSHAYGMPPGAEAARALLRSALDLGVVHFDTAALYGFGQNEELLGALLAPHRRQILLASKCGMTGVEGKRVIDGRPQTLRRTLEDSLRRLRTDVIDLYYLHRVDRAVPVEDSIGAMSRMVAEGKVRAIGLSEVSAATLRRAHAVHPIAAVQSEYALWSRNPELGVLDACEAIGAAFVAFSPLGRGFFAGAVRDPAQLVEKDIRRGFPRFQEPDFSRNLALLSRFTAIAAREDIRPAQLALAWVLQRRPFIHVIPGTTSIEHLAVNWGALQRTLPAAVLAEFEELQPASGARYTAQTQAEIDTERFENE